MLEKSILLDPDRKYYAYVSKGTSMIFTDEDNMKLGKVQGFSLFENKSFSVSACPNLSRYLLTIQEGWE